GHSVSPNQCSNPQQPQVFSANGLLTAPERSRDLLGISSRPEALRANAFAASMFGRCRWTVGRPLRSVEKAGRLGAMAAPDLGVLSARAGPRPAAIGSCLGRWRRLVTNGA